MTKALTRERVHLAHSLRGNTPAGKASKQEQEAASHIEIAVKKQREMSSRAQLASSFSSLY